jgi:hypothetical protein
MHEMEGLVHKTGKYMQIGTLLLYCIKYTTSYARAISEYYLFPQLSESGSVNHLFLRASRIFAHKLRKISRIISWSKFMKSAVLVFCVSVLMLFVLLGLYRL